MPRFFCPQPLVTGAIIDLPEAVAHHIQVVRLAVGEEVTLFNGEGGQYQARLASVAKRSVTAEVLAHDPREAELPFAITLAQALPEASKMDWIIEKAVELGVAAVQPLAAQRCVVRLSSERAEKKLSHWQGIIVSASEQCGRNRLASLSSLEEFSRWIAHPAAAPRILLSPRGTQTLAEWAAARQAHDLALMVGPEGGFSSSEEDAAIAAGAIALSMGPRVLRTETAALAAITTLQARWG
ncbi:16S rRNA (uracil(1498)-N(3))-methyltransferase [Janthinobacterium aquaticum]|uniref:16S rRNA (uracil(1498)-N(3))-methyltransferase n=1 Tax=Janthinobacterium sp. FT58W TaxID=2654254 RepID=UPI0012659F05|nr:16S rRNA (uracil(1498)-N(3))-methyltransferase [Janthinobacterium sp. FT58W]KAB8042247.1 16S rRNA (uracil(1498)-N(3))-methyltransferase [Janthinobacterium sp. FT58W]